MPDDDLPPELRRRHSIPVEAIPLELPLDTDLTPPIPETDRPAPTEPRNPEPFLRRS
jgi:hypothetical protein